MTETTALTLTAAGGRYTPKQGILNLIPATNRPRGKNIDYLTEAKELLEFISTELPAGTADWLVTLMLHDNRFDCKFLGE